MRIIVGPYTIEVDPCDCADRRDGSLFRDQPTSILGEHYRVRDGRSAKPCQSAIVADRIYRTIAVYPTDSGTVRSVQSLLDEYTRSCAAIETQGAGVVAGPGGMTIHVDLLDRAQGVLDRLGEGSEIQRETARSMTVFSVALALARGTYDEGAGPIVIQDGPGVRLHSRAPGERPILPDAPPDATAYLHRGAMRGTPILRQPWCENCAKALPVPERGGGKVYCTCGKHAPYRIAGGVRANAVIPRPGDPAIAARRQEAIEVRAEETRAKFAPKGKIKQRCGRFDKNGGYHA